MIGLHAFLFIAVHACHDMLQAYYPGQSVSGSIQVVVRESKLYQYVGVGFEGKGKVHWTETVSRGNARYGRSMGNTLTDTIHYSDKETYVDMIIVVWGNKEAPQTTKLDPGTFTFPFQFTIPADCPPTYNTQRGQISYQVYGIIASQVKEYKIDTPLTVNRLIDLNQQPNLLQAYEKADVKNMSVCCCCKTDESAMITFKMPRTGFCVIREQIPVTFECTNESSIGIDVCVEVIQRTVYIARSCEKSFEIIIGNFSCQIQLWGQDTKSVEFDLPSSVQLPIATRIINVFHSARLWVTCKRDCCSEFDGPLIDVPITLGNVPFQDPAPS